MNLAQEILNAVPQHVRDEIMKGAEIKTTYTWDPASRSVFSPENLSEEIKLLVPIDTPLRNRIPRVGGKGEAAAWKKMTSSIHSKNSSTAGAGTLTTIAFADAAAPSETSQTYAVTAAAYKLLGRKVEVGGLAQAASQGGTDMLESRERIKMYEVMLGEEELIIGGDATFAATEFDGLLKQITTNSGNTALLTVSGIGSYCKSLADTYGAYPNYLVAAGFQLAALANQLQGSGSINRINIMGDSNGATIGGFQLKSIVSPIPGAGLIEVLHNRFMGNNALLLTMKSPAGENWIEMEDLIPMSRVDVPSTTFSYVRFVLEATVLKVIGEPFQYKIQGLATS